MDLEPSTSKKSVKKSAKKRVQASQASEPKHDSEETLGAFWPKKKRKLHTYEKRQLQFEQATQEKERAKEAKSRAKAERAAAAAEYQKRKAAKYRTMQQRTKKGQPKLAGQVNLLLDKLQRTMHREKKRQLK